MNATGTEVRDRLIVALDVGDAREALDLDRRLGDAVSWVKIGLELFVAEGPSVVTRLRERGRRVFLDLKLHDIPNTVAGAVRSAAGLGAELLTLHVEGGPAMMTAAAVARAESGSSLRLLGVTVLTSLTGSEFPEVYRDDDVGRRVRSFTTAAVDSGLDGVVCSPHEVHDVRARTPAAFLRVTPGIRPPGGEVHDQSRVATPASALASGATHLVVGRAITGSADPRGAAERLLGDMAAAGPPA